jgi:hypothetical protein
MHEAAGIDQIHQGLAFGCVGGESAVGAGAKTRDVIAALITLVGVAGRQQPAELRWTGAAKHGTAKMAVINFFINPLLA